MHRLAQGVLRRPASDEATYLPVHTERSHVGQNVRLIERGEGGGVHLVPSGPTGRPNGPTVHTCRYLAVASKPCFRKSGP